MQKPTVQRLSWLSALAAYLGLGVGSAYPSDDQDMQARTTDRDSGGATPHSAQLPGHSTDSPAVDAGGAESSNSSASGIGEVGPGASEGTSEGAGDSGGGDGAGD